VHLLLQVDGKTNAKIQSFFLDNYPITCAQFTRDGEQVVIASRHNAFKYLDMMESKVVNVPYKGTQGALWVEKSCSRIYFSAYQTIYI